MYTVQHLLKEYKDAEARYANAVRTAAAIQENGAARLGTNAQSMTFSAAKLTTLLDQETEERRAELESLSKKIDAINELLAKED